MEDHKLMARGVCVCVCVCCVCVLCEGAVCESFFVFLVLVYVFGCGMLKWILCVICILLV